MKLTNKTFRETAHELVDWIADYLENTEQYAVKSQAKPKEIYNQIPENPPTESEAMATIFEDFKNIILPGMTHWQSPNFYAYFPANSSYPSLLAEMLMSTLGAQCMIWDTSPAAAELEEKVMNWLKQIMALPNSWQGVIQDTASTASLAALLTAREKLSDYKVNESGFENAPKYRVYCSTQTHSSIDKAVKIAGLGIENLVKVAVNDDCTINVKALETAIQNDIQNGFQPLFVMLALGTTSTIAIDKVRPVGEICRKYNIWLHLDAAYAGSALILPEYRAMIDGIELADSFVFNPHKWLFTNFDCSAYFVKDADALVNTFTILPEYLKTKTRGLVNDYRDWGIPLGRRFRALKLWFVIRNFGVNGLREKLRFHIDLAKAFEVKVKENPNFEIVFPRSLNGVFFRFKPNGITDLDELNQLNETLLHSLNESGKLYLSHTKVNGIYFIRMIIAQTNVNIEHVDNAWLEICKTAKLLL
ncbi:MAG: aspartate aminotransferase family protein [Saprospiraceae bacterium]